MNIIKPEIDQNQKKVRAWSKIKYIDSGTGEDQEENAENEEDKT